VRACEAFFERYYVKAPNNIESQMTVGPAAFCAEWIAKSFEQGLNTMVLGLIVPDLEQLDLLATKILPQLRI